MRLGATMVDEIKSQLLDSLRTVPKTVVARERQAVDLIAAVQRRSARFKITRFPPAEVSIPDLRVALGAISAADFPEADLWPSSMRVELVSIGPVHAKAIFHQLIKKDRELPDRRPLTK
jgi:hypothetical protein